MHRTQKGIENTVDIVLSKGVTAHLNMDCPGGYSNMEWSNCDIQCMLHIKVLTFGHESSMYYFLNEYV